VYTSAVRNLENLGFDDIERARGNCGTVGAPTVLFCNQEQICGVAISTEDYCTQIDRLRHLL
jgi:hypothetical protein